MARAKHNPPSRGEPSPRLGVLWRDVDESGVSGTGLVAWLVVWPDGTAVMRWCAQGMAGSTAVYASIGDLERIHGHGGRTKVRWLPRLDATRLLADTGSARVAVESYERRLAAAAGQPGRLDWVSAAAAAAAYVPQLVAAYEGVAAEVACARADRDRLAGELAEARERLHQVVTEAEQREARLRAELDAAYSALEATADATPTVPVGGG